MAKGFVPECLYDHHLSAANPFWMGIADRGPPEVTSIHVHNGLEIHLTLSGLFEFRFGQLAIPVAEGETALCSMWEPHQVELRAPEGNSAIAMIFLPEFLAKGARDAAPWMRLFTARAKDRPRVRRARTRESVLAIGRHLRDEMMGRRNRWEEMVRLDVLRLLLVLEREWRLPPGKQQIADIDPADFARVMPAVSRVHADLSHRVSCAEAAAECGFSESHFRALFRRAMGVGFGWFGLRARLGFAAHCLTSTGLPVCEIAQVAAFADLSHFHRVFEKHFGCNPSRYRARTREERPPGLLPGFGPHRRATSWFSVHLSEPGVGAVER